MLDTPLKDIAGMPPHPVRVLAKEGITTAGEVLWMLPFRHEDRRRMDGLAFEPSETPACHHIRVVKTSNKFFGRRRGAGVFEAQTEAAAGSALGQTLTLRWFNMPFMTRAIAGDMELIVYGKIKEGKGRLFMDHPEYEVVKESDEENGAGIHTGRITPVYRLRGGLSQKALRVAAWHVLESFGDHIVDDLLPTPSENGEFCGWTRSRALHTVHFPATNEELDLARRYLALEEFYGYQVRVVRRRQRVLEAGGREQGGSGDLIRAFREEIPFDFTNAQERSLKEILRDMEAAAPMNRLLHGDVGSGKTVVAFAAMLRAVEAGGQALLMAPTQILAEQHYQNARKWLEPLGVRVMLRIGARSTAGPAVFPGGLAGDVLTGGAGGALAAAAGGDAGDGSGGMELAGRENASGEAAGRDRRAACAPVTAALSGVSETRYSKRNLPHFERPWGKYMITFVTDDRWVMPEECRSMVLDCILHWKDVRYRLYATCVMPDHVHLLIEPLPEERDAKGDPVFFSLTKILHTIKSFTAHEIVKRGFKKNRHVWQEESLDTMIHSESDLQEKFDYILENPWVNNVVTRDEKYAWLWHPAIESEQRARSTAGPAVFPGGLAGDVLAGGAGGALAAAAGGDAGDGSGGMELAGRENAFGEAAKRDRRAACAPGGAASPHVLIGTHALLYERDMIRDAGLVVIDEQHKFGVAQRARLIQKGGTPDVLVMTATPIPRTLTLTIYGDLDVSTLDERPKNRGKIITKVRPASKKKEAATFLREQIEAGRQGYLVYPLIEESEKVDAAAAKKGFEEWNALLAPHRVGLLHGKMDAEEKENVMRAFRSGEVQALVSTTVIEVGVDVPNATVMFIHSAERHGLAQLHQLRGRIGRGEHTSYCVLFVKEDDEESKARLAIMEETNDGFVIAEEDLRRRGPGDVLGRAQSGQAPLRFAELLADTRLVRLARQLAEKTLADDPHLARPEHQELKELTEETDAPQEMLQ
jgi:RecG-like helicase/REP element-mobilizing transposase RayT